MSKVQVNAISGRTRNRRGEGERLREEIVAAALSLLDETGDERAVSLRSVARRVGIAAPSIYSHFPDRPAVVLAVVRHSFAELERELQASAAAAGNDPVARLWAAGLAYLDFARDRPERYRTMFGDARTAGTLSVLGVLSTLLSDCVASGKSSCSGSSEDAMSLWLGLHGLAHQRAVTRTFPWPDRLDRLMISTLAHLVTS